MKLVVYIADDRPEIQLQLPGVDIEYKLTHTTDGWYTWSLPSQQLARFQLLGSILYYADHNSAASYWTPLGKRKRPAAFMSETECDTYIALDKLLRLTSRIEKVPVLDLEEVLKHTKLVRHRERNYKAGDRVQADQFVVFEDIEYVPGDLLTVLSVEEDKALTLKDLDAGYGLEHCWHPDYVTRVRSKP